MRINVLYTKHITKKRKTYSDGILKVTFNRGNCFCSLIDVGDVREVSLETRHLEAAEAQLILSRTPHTLKLENHIIDLTFDDQAPESAPPVQPALKIPKKFVPPSRYEPADKFLDDGPSSYSTSRSNFSVAATVQKSSSASFSRNRYPIEDEELDEIWDTGNSNPPNHQDHSRVPQQKTSVPPARNFQISNGNQLRPSVPSRNQRVEQNNEGEDSNNQWENEDELNDYQQKPQTKYVRNNQNQRVTARAAPVTNINSRSAPNYAENDSDDGDFDGIPVSRSATAEEVVPPAPPADDLFAGFQLNSSIWTE